MATVVVGSYVVQFPVGGYLSWVLQWLVGLRDLGHEVWFVEKALGPGSCFDPVAGLSGDDPSFGTRSLDDLLRRFGLADQWCFIDAAGLAHGQPYDSLLEVFDRADLFIDMGTFGSLAAESARATRRILVDGEPGGTQMRMANAYTRGERAGDYDAYVTVGLNIGAASCSVPTAGVAWKPSVYPVVPAIFPVIPPPPDAPYTTIMSWSAHDETTYEGRTYGAKDLEFPKFIDLPGLVDVDMEIAVSGRVPGQQLDERGWRRRSAHDVTITFDHFRDYIRNSRGEFSVCKNSFVATRSGWMGDRAAAYLASGRPVVMQDTGFSEHLPCGEGLFAVSSVEQAAEAIREIESDYERHSRAARLLAETHFAAELVLGRLLAEVLP